MIASAQRRFPPRLFAGALALALLGGQAASVAHFALVGHTACLDHGLAMHGDAGAGHSHGSPTATAGWTEGDGDVDHGHEHCTVVAVRRDTAGELGVCCSGTALRPRPAGSPLAAVDFFTADEVWRVAPKQSPPAA